MGLKSSEAPLLSIIVPAYNEAENIPRLLERVHRALQGISYEIVIVDDGSPDGTSEIAKGLAVSRGYPLMVLQRRGVRGKVSALLDGFKASRGVYVAFLDADLEWPPEAVRRMMDLAITEGYKVVVGYRRSDRRPFLRRVISGGARLLSKLVIPGVRGLRDPTSELLLAKREVIEGARIRDWYIKPFLPVLAKVDRKDVGEVEIEQSSRVSGESKFRPFWILEYLVELEEVSGHVVLKVVFAASLGAFAANLVSPIIGIHSIFVSLGIRAALLFKIIGLAGILASEAISLLVKFLAMPSLGLLGWILAAFLETLTATILRSE